MNLNSKSEQVAKEITNATGIKVSADDPTVAMILLIDQRLKKQGNDQEKILSAFIQSAKNNKNKANNDTLLVLIRRLCIAILGVTILNTLLFVLDKL